jgi:hypothetical protein
MTPMHRWKGGASMRARGMVTQAVSVVVSLINVACAVLLERALSVVFQTLVLAMLTTVIGSLAKTTNGARWSYWLLCVLGVWWLSYPRWVVGWRMPMSQWCAIGAGIATSVVALMALTLRAR